MEVLEKLLREACKDYLRVVETEDETHKYEA